MTVVLLYFGVGGLFPNDSGLHLKCSRFEAELFRGGWLGRQLCRRVWGGLERCRRSLVWLAYQGAMWCLGRSPVLCSSVLLCKTLWKHRIYFQACSWQPVPIFLHHFLVSSKGVSDTSSEQLWPFRPVFDWRPVCSLGGALCIWGWTPSS